MIGIGSYTTSTTNMYNTSYLKGVFRRTICQQRRRSRRQTFGQRGTVEHWKQKRRKWTVVVSCKSTINRKRWKKICSDQSNTPSSLDHYFQLHNEYHQHVWSKQISHTWYFPTPVAAALPPPLRIPHENKLRFLLATIFSIAPPTCGPRIRGLSRLWRCWNRRATVAALRIKSKKALVLILLVLVFPHTIKI